MLCRRACSIVHYARMPSSQCRCTVVLHVVAVSSFCRYAFDTVRDGSNEMATAFEWCTRSSRRRSPSSRWSIGPPSRAHGVLTGYPAGPRGAARLRADCRVKTVTRNMQHAAFNIGCTVQQRKHRAAADAISDATSDARYRCTRSPRRGTAASRRRSPFCEARSMRSSGNDHLTNIDG
jgi:hypothetical protein